MSTISARSALVLADSFSDDEPVITHASASGRTRTMTADTEKDEALRQAQLELDAMKEQCRVLQEKTRIAEANKTRKSSKRAVPDALSAFDHEVQSLSKKYGILVEMFPPSRDLLSRPLTPSVSNASPASLDIVGKARYASGLAEEAAILAELDSFLPLHIQNIRTSNHFADQLESGVGSGRSSELHKLRSVAGDLFGLPSLDLSCDAASRRLESPEIRALLGVQIREDNKPWYPTFPPLLYANNRVNQATPFSNWELLGSILRVVFWGRAALTHKATRRPGGKANGTLWGVTSCTPGCLAWAAIMAIFLVSPDSQFPKGGVGATSRIPYQKLFGEYKRLFITNWDSAYVCELVSKINQRVFGKTKATADDSEDFTADIDAAMAAMAMAIPEAVAADSESQSMQVNDLDHDPELALTGQPSGAASASVALDANAVLDRDIGGQAQVVASATADVDRSRAPAGENPSVLLQSEEHASVLNLAHDINETVSVRGRARARGGNKKSGKAAAVNGANAAVTRALRSAAK